MESLGPGDKKATIIRTHPHRRDAGDNRGRKIKHFFGGKKSLPNMNKLKSRNFSSKHQLSVARS